MFVGKTRPLVITLLLALVLPSTAVEPAQAQATSRLFPETGKTVRGPFLSYWSAHGGLAQQGYPISEEMKETSPTDGNTYTVQYFERAVFEQHPELPAPHNVLLSLLGNFLYEKKYPDGAPGQAVSSAPGAVLFKETGKHLGGAFLKYWQQNGGLAQQGYPISEEFTEVSDLDGKTYRVQYFERAVFEAHPEKQPPYNVLLSQLGTFRYRDQFGALPSFNAGCGSPIEQGTWTGALSWGFTLTSPALKGSGLASGPVQLNVACDGSFTGIVQVNSYSANISGNNVAILTCSTSKPPIADIAGRVEEGPDGKRLNITGGTYRQGVVLCANPITAARPTNLADGPVAPTTVKIETMTANKIGGTQWVPDASYVSTIEQFRKVYQNVQIVYNGQWELTRQEVNSP